MRIQDLQPAAGSRSHDKRIGRGIGSGIGKTSAKGHKGQRARSGGGKQPGFEGGQMPLARRLPKRGFTNNFRKVYSTVNIRDLEEFNNGDVITLQLLIESKIVSKAEPYGLKVLGAGELTKSLTVQAAKFTEGAKKAIETAGGKAEVIQ